MEVKNLGEVIDFNHDFKTAINLYLSLNKTDKVLNYIPTKSSLRFLDSYLEAVINKKEHATLLVGPYGKGKSHLLLVLLAVLSLVRNDENNKIVNKLKNRVKNVEEIGNKTASDIEKVWKTKGFLPVIINVSTGDLKQALLVALQEALKREKLEDITPMTSFSEALKRIDEWENIYPDTFTALKKVIKNYGYTIKTLRMDLKNCMSDALEVYGKVYPDLTAGSSFNVFATSDVLSLYKNVSDLLVEDYNYSGIYIVFDEFSKFIEGIDGTNAGNTMKILQDICELAEESSNSQIYITMVAHKSIKEYGKYLSSEIINAFTGIEGRIIEKYFVTSSKNNYELIRSAIVKKQDKMLAIPGIDKMLGDENANYYYQLPAFRSNFELEDFKNIVLKGCYPLNPIAAYLLLNVSEKVAQNERTLFTFISNDEPNSLARFVSEHNKEKGWIIGAELIYDYFSVLFKKEVSNELVHNIWLGAEYAISKCSNEEEKKLVKTLALFLIVNKGEELPATEKYLSLAAALIDGNTTIKSLSQKKLIYKKSSIGAYVFKTRAGSELKAEIKKQRELKGNNCSYSKVISLITAKYFTIPRKYNAEKKMTRYFRYEYMDVDTFMSISDANAFFDNEDNSDGKVIAIFGLTDLDYKEIKGHYEKLKCKKLVVIVPRTKISTAKELIDYEILQDIRSDISFISTNEVLKKEIPLLEEDIVKAVEDDLFDVYSSADTKIYFWHEGAVNEGSFNALEKIVDLCCEEVYFKTPIINNEMINRAEITTAQTKKARLNIIDAILNHEDTEDFYSGTNQEATIYRALFGKSDKVDFDKEHIDEVNNLINNFVTSCSDKKVRFSALIDILINEPYGIRKGVIPVYLAKVLSEREEDLVVYFADMEVQITPDVVVNICDNSSEYSLFVSKSDIQKEKYIKKMNGLFSVEESRALTENRIKNIVLCMQRWFRALPQVSRNLASINESSVSKNQLENMKALKKMLQGVDLNPYEILFVNIPREFKVKDLEEAYVEIKSCKESYDNYLIKMNERVVDGIYKVWEYKSAPDLYHLLKEWYKKQSNISKQGLHSGGITNLMSCIEKLDVYADIDVAQKVVKAVTNVYLENWIDDAYESFIKELTSVKNKVEQIKEEKSEGKFLLSFNGSNGKTIERYYEKVNEGTGVVLRNIIEEALDEYDDLSVNDRIAILLDMIEKIIG